MNVCVREWGSEGEGDVYIYISGICREGVCEREREGERERGREKEIGEGIGGQNA